MKLLLPLLLVMATIAGAQESDHPAYDAALARNLGADEHGMKMYTLVL